MSSKRPCPARHRPQGLDILHEDRDHFVINKHAGLLSTPTPKGEINTAEGNLTTYIRKGSRVSRLAAWLVHRLDRDTSGIMLYAKTEAVRDKLQSTWPQTQKYYIATLCGRLDKPTGTLEHYLAENEDQYVYPVNDPALGRLCLTRYAIISQTDDTTTVKIQLLTGRKNQIRVQFAAIGYPILGDKKYNRKGPKADRLYLHAVTIIYPHPHSGKIQTHTAPIPPQFHTTQAQYDAITIPDA